MRIKHSCVNNELTGNGREETNETKSKREYKPSGDFSAKAKFTKEQRRTRNKTRNKRNKAKINKKYKLSDGLSAKAKSALTTLPH